MCGIAGVFARASGQSVPDIRERLTAMAEAEHHRGPDDGGIYLLETGRGGLANRRLAIRDPSSLGHMPMGNDAGTVWITYNGEIYNADELRADLERVGHVFRSHSDTEVILHGYEAWGKGIVDRLRGIFAFAILDTPCRTLFLARDRLGVKPLYYAECGSTFLFASELKALQASRLVGRELSPAAVVGYLMLGSVPNPLTIYRDIRALEAGHTLTVRLDCGEQALAAPYWTLPAEMDEPVDRGTAIEQVRALLEEAVRIELASDVPLGAFLSGGLDSSAIVALMRAATNGPMRTCSITFEEATYSEAPYARAMAESVGAEHFERVLTMRDVERELGTILQSIDQPTIDGVNTYFVAQTAREAGLTVALSGLGGDELFGGYHNTFRSVPQILRALTVAKATPGGTMLAKRAIDVFPHRHRWTRVQDALDRSPSLASAYLTRRGLFSVAETRTLVRPDIWEQAMREFDPIRSIQERIEQAVAAHQEEPFGWISRAELTSYTHNQLLRDTDVMSMAHSLEVRVPLLDHKVVEAVLRLPSSLKRTGEGPKPLLRAAVGNRLPEPIRRRRDKRGFVFPFDLWIPRLLQPTAAGEKNSILRDQELSRLRCLHAAGKIHWSRPWAVAVLQGWMRETAR